MECTKGGCRLEIKHNDEWGTICSQGWKDVNAVVACRSMGMPDGKSVRDFGMKFKKQAPENYKTWVSGACQFCAPMFCRDHVITG